MSDAERQAELRDCEETLTFLREQLDRQAADLAAQIARTEGVYGHRHQSWPASSEMHVRGMEDALAETGHRLTAVYAYREELSA